MAKEAGMQSTCSPSKEVLCICDLLATKAMQDAGVKYTEIEQAVVGYVYGKREWKWLGE